MKTYKIENYTTGWFRAKRRPGKSIDIELARELYSKESLYSAVITKDNQYYAFIQHTKDFFYVGFLDSKRREYLKYIYNDAKYKSHLFLKEVQYWKYYEESDMKTHSEIYQFNETGELRIHKTDIKRSETITLTSVNKIDVDGFYEAFPKFGEYEHLINIDRMESLNLDQNNPK